MLPYIKPSDSEYRRLASERASPFVLGRARLATLVTSIMAAIAHSPVPPTGPIAIAAPGRPWGVEPVELLVKNGVQVVPEKYKREFSASDLVTPDISSCTDHDIIDGEKLSIPVIDLRGWDESHMEEVVAEMKRACETWGFFRIVNHGVPPLLMDGMMEVAREFMALPVEEKAGYAAEPGGITQGYGSKYILEEDKVRDWRDYLYLLLQPPSIRNYSHWPASPPSFRETMEEYSREVRQLAGRLLRVMSRSLGMDDGFIEKALRGPEPDLVQKMLINYYPACPQPDLTAGFHKHSDIGALTVLLQEEGVVGLHVRHYQSGRWIPVETLKHSFVCNVADQIEILTNGMYKSVEHRAIVNKDMSRISIALFHDAAPTAIIGPSQELKQGPLYKEVMFSDHEYAFYAHGARSKSIVQSYIIGK